MEALRRGPGMRRAGVGGIIYHRRPLRLERPARVLRSPDRNKRTLVIELQPHPALVESDVVLQAAAVPGLAARTIAEKARVDCWTPCPVSAGEEGGVDDIRVPRRPAGRWPKTKALAGAALVLRPEHADARPLVQIHVDRLAVARHPLQVPAREHVDRIRNDRRRLLRPACSAARRHAGAPTH